MNVFIPAKKDINPFFDEIMFHSKHHFIFGEFEEYSTSYKTVLIHWPEQLFNWKEPTVKELENLQENIKIWKQHSKLVYVVHNLQPHNAKTLNFSKLYNLILRNCDIMVHFGAYSHKLYAKEYPEAAHQIIYHPLYEKSYKIYTKEFARKKLNIKKDALVIIAPGSIRNEAEKKIVLNAFKKLKIKKKTLIIPRMLEFDLTFKGRVFLKRFIDVKKWFNIYKKWIYKKPTYYFNYNFLENDNLSLLMSASDIVFIPRIKILNSGNVFLALTFQKLMIGPNQGNLTEFFELFKLPYFNPQKDTTIHKALNDVVNLYKGEAYKYDTNLLQKFKPLVIAEQWDQLIDIQSKG